MTHLYFKSNAPELMAVSAKTRDMEQAVRDEAKAFAAEFGGDAVMTRFVGTLRCAGLKFSPPRDTRLWTVPDGQTGGVQHPRGALPAGGADRKSEKAALAALQAKWKASAPTLRADIDRIFEAAGFNLGNIWLTGGTLFEWDGYLYFSAATRPGPLLIEIMGSEYAAAQELARNAREQSKQGRVAA